MSPHSKAKAASLTVVGDKSEQEWKVIMQMLIQQKIQMGFAVALAFLLLTGASAWWSERRNVETFRAVDHTREVIGKLQDTLVEMLNIQTGTRGFAIAGDEAFLQPYQAGIASVETSFAEVKRLTQDNPDQQRRLAALEPLIQKKISREKEIIKLRRSGDTAGALQLIASGQGKRAMDEIRKLIAEMAAEENQLLQQRTAKAQALSRTTIAVVVLGSLFAVGLVGLAGGIVRRDFAKRQRAEAERDRFFTLSLDMLAIASTDGYFKRVNPAFTATLGWSMEELLARPFMDFVHPDDRDATGRVVETLSLGQPLLHFENRFQCQDGSWKTISWRSTPQPDGTLYSTGRDVTELKAAANALRRSEEKLAVTLNSIGDAVLATDAKGVVTRLNPIAEKLTGWTHAEALGRHVADVFRIINEETRQPAVIPVDDVLATGEIHGLANHTVIIARDGTEYPIADSAAPIRDKDGRILGVVLVFRDVTEENHAHALEAARATVLERLANAATLGEVFDVLMRHVERIYPNHPATILLLDEAGRLRNAATTGLPDFYNAAIEGMAIGAGVGSCGDAATTKQRSVAEDIETHPNWQPYLELTRRAGLRSCWSQPMLGDDGRVLGTFAIYSRTPKSPGEADIRLLEECARLAALALQRRQAEEALHKFNATLDQQITERTGELRKSEEQFRLIVESVKDYAIIMLDTGGHIVSWNAGAKLIKGYEADEIIGQHFSRFYPKEDVESGKPPRSLEVAVAEGRFEEEGWRVRKDGSRFMANVVITAVRDDAGEVRGFAKVSRDITERQKHEHLALRSQRLESIGTLASGVAHDLNNALAPILMGVELLKMQYPEESKIVDMFEASARHGADMVKQLMGFAKGVEGVRVSLQPGRLVREMESLMKGSFPKSIRLVVKCDPKLPVVMGDATQLHQVLLNLCVNARDAMPRGGTLTLEVQHVEVDAAYASSIPNAQPGKYLILRVRDTGIGIPPEIIDRIFEPFFSTKGPDKGTGLGLSTVMGIVKGHGGFLQVYSQPGQGTTFTAYLPANGAVSDTEHITKETVEFHGQGECILLVDDEVGVREIGRAVLHRLNFKPLTATDGADGLIQAAQHRTELRAIITDLHMPHMDGLTFVRTVRRMLPDIPIVVTSGRMDDSVAEEFKALGVTSRMDKPFTEAQLAEALKNLLTRR